MYFCRNKQNINPLSKFCTIYLLLTTYTYQLLFIFLFTYVKVHLSRSLEVLFANVHLLLVQKLTFQSEHSLRVRKLTFQSEHSLRVRKNAHSMRVRKFTFAKLTFIACPEDGRWKMPLKGSVSWDFRPPFFHDSTPFGSLINRLRYFRIWFRFRQDIWSQRDQNFSL